MYKNLNPLFLTEISKEYIVKKATEQANNLVKYGKKGKGQARLETLDKLNKMLSRKKNKATQRVLDASEGAQMTRRNHASIKDAIDDIKKTPIK